MSNTTKVIIGWAVLATAVAAVLGVVALRRSGSPAAVGYGALPPAAPTPTPTPLPTRVPAEVPAQDAAANLMLEHLRQVGEGRDPASLPEAASLRVMLVACPYGCDNHPRLAGFRPDPVARWERAESATVLSDDEARVTLRAPLSGAKAIDHGAGPREAPLQGTVSVVVSRHGGRGWEPVNVRFQPALVPARPAGAPPRPLPTPRVPTMEDFEVRPEALADRVLMSLSTTALGDPIPYDLPPAVQRKLQWILNPPGSATRGGRVMGLSVRPHSWERRPVRDPRTGRMLPADEAISLVAYLSGEVTIEGPEGAPEPEPLDPRVDHLTVTLHKRGGEWVVSDVTDDGTIAAPPPLRPTPVAEEHPNG